MKKWILFFVLGVVFIANLQAQSRKEKKMQAAINVLIETEFMDKFKEYKGVVEASAVNFKTKAEYYDEAKVKEIMTGFDETKQEFNVILEGIKEDLMDNDKREFITKKPEDYAQLIDYKLEKAMESFHNNVAYKIGDLTGEEVVGFGIVEVGLLIRFVSHLMNNFSTIKQGFKQMNEDYLQQNFMEPLQIESWNELGSNPTGN